VPKRATCLERAQVILKITIILKKHTLRKIIKVVV